MIILGHQGKLVKDGYIYVFEKDVCELYIRGNVFAEDKMGHVSQQ